MVVLRRPVVVSDPRSGSIDPGSRSQPSTPFPATMVQSGAGGRTRRRDEKKSTEDPLGLSGVGPRERIIRANRFSDLPVASVGNFVFG
jgi:hypothetical protein